MSVFEARELFPEVEADGSAGNISLNVGRNDWRADDALSLVDMRGPMAENVRNPIFTLPPSYQAWNERNPADYVKIFFHKNILIMDIWPSAC